MTEVILQGKGQRSKVKGRWEGEKGRKRNGEE